MAEKPVRHRYPRWLAWPLELVATVIVVLTTWHYLSTLLQYALQQWPFLLDNLGQIPYVKQLALGLFGLSGFTPPAPVPWESLYDPLWRLNASAFGYFFLAALLRNFLPRLSLHDKGLLVRRGLGWATVPWDRITLASSMSLPGDRIVILIQGRRWGLGPWFRFYSLLWGGGLKKGIPVAWHISNFETLADGLVAHLQQVYSDEDLALVVDDTAYSLIYALLFLPRATWKTVFAPKRGLADAFAHPRWVHAVSRGAAIVLLVLAIWRYLGVWWRFLTGYFEVLMNALYWPLIGPLLGTFGPRESFSAEAANFLARPEIALLLAQVNMILTLVAVVFLFNFFPDWLLGVEGPSVDVRKRWMQIPWLEISSIRETIFSNGRGVILLQVKRSCLTFWHTLYSLFYGAGLRRGVLFTSLLPGFGQMRERVHLGVVRAHEKDTHPPERPILQEQGEADYLLMLRDPAATLRRWGEMAEPEPRGSVGGLLRRPPGYTPIPAGDLPWEQTADEGPSAAEKVATLDLRRAIRVALTLAIFPLLLVLLEELLFPPLSRPLAFFALGPLSSGRMPVLWLVSAVLMGLFTMGEWPLCAFLMSTIAETYEQPGQFRRVLFVYPRIQSPRIAAGVLLLILGVTGVIQPLFLLWWILGTLWGALLVWLTGHELYEWRGAGNLLLMAGFILYQGLVLLVYLMLR